MQLCPTWHSSYSIQTIWRLEVPRVLPASDIDCTPLCFSRQSKLYNNTRVEISKTGLLSSFRKELVYTRTCTLDVNIPSFLVPAYKLALPYIGMANGSCQNTLTSSLICEPSGTDVTTLLLLWQGKWKEIGPRGPFPNFRWSITKL